MSTTFRILVLLHILCVIGGFGGVAYNALYMSLAQRRSGGGTGAIIEINRLVSGMAEILIYAALLFGVGAVTASQKHIKFSDAWIGAASAVYLVDIGILHGWIRPRSRRYATVVGRLEQPAPTGEQGGPPPSRDADMVTLHSLEKQVGFGWGVFNVLVIGAVYLMVFRPGH